MAKKKSASSKPSTFEESLKQLETIVGKLESGKLSLAESLQQYEDGVRHLRSCYALLEDAERKIELVSGLDSEGRAKSEAYEDPGRGDLAAKGSARSGRRSVKSPPRKSVEDDGDGKLF